MPATATSDALAWQEIASKLQATGWCARVMIGEPKSPPQPITACIIGDSGVIDETVLNSPRQWHTSIIRLYGAFLDEPEESLELDLEQVRANIWADICGDFELGGNVAYIEPTRCSWRWGNLQVGQQMYRVLDISVTYRVDGRATFVA